MNKRVIYTIIYGYVLWALLGIYPVAAQNNPMAGRTYTAKKLHADFKFLYHTLITGNPGAFYFTTPAHLDSVYKRLAAHISNDESTLQFKMQCDSLITAIHCGHTGIFFDSKYVKRLQKNKVFNWDVAGVVLRDKWYVYKSFLHTDTTIKAGDEIIAVNNVPTYVILQKTESLLPADGFNTTSKSINASFFMPYVFMACFWNSSDTLRFTLQDSTGHIKHDAVTLSALTQHFKYTDHTTDTLITAYSVKDHVLKFAKHDSTVAFMTIKSFSGNSYFYKMAFQIMSQKHVRKLVIDLRANPGGQIMEAETLLDYLLDSATALSYKTYNNHFDFTRHINLKGRWSYNLTDWLFSKIDPYTDSGNVRTYTLADIKPVTNNHYDGQCAVLINGGSFSAACIVASYLKDHKKAVFVGRETGGAQYGCNAVILPLVSLPHTALRLRLPLYSILYKVKNKNYGHGIMPDYPIDYTIRQLLQKVDPDMVKAISVLKSQKQ